MCKETEWKEHLTDFLKGAEGDYHEFKKSVINNGTLCSKHTVYSDSEILSWVVDNKTDTILEVEHVVR